MSEVAEYIEGATSSIREEVARAIQDQLEGDWTTNNTVAFMEYFGERAADAVIAATLNALLADLDERGFSIALWQAHDRHSIRRWIEGHREGQKWTRP